MKWQFRFIKNALFGILPFPYHLRKIKRKFFPYNLAINEWTLELGIRQVEMLESVHCPVRDKTILEIGTGWQPVLPLLFSIAGGKEIITVDIQRLLDRHTLLETIKGLKGYKDLLSRRLGIPAGRIEEMLNIENMKELSEEAIFNKLNIRYLAPYDITAGAMPAQSIDIIMSCQVIEHIPLEVIKKINAASCRILRANGKMCHIIDNSDHWEHDDKSISRLNYLKFSDFHFGIISNFNPLSFQNRLRHFEYIELYNQSGFKVDSDKSVVNAEALAALKNLKLDPKYKQVKHEDLAILTSCLVLSKK